MAKIQGPLLSMGGTGQIGHSQVYSTWKGRPYVRRYVIPSNPQSAEQSKTRDVFSFLTNIWRLASADFVSPWTAFAKNRVMTNRNAFMQKNVKLLRPKGDDAADSLLGFFMSPGAKGGIVAPIEYTLTGGDLVASIDVPDPLPSGWACTGIVVAAIPEQDPQGTVDLRLFSASGVGGDPGDTLTVTIADIGADVYAVSAWLTFQRTADPLDIAYGAAIATLQTVTA